MSAEDKIESNNRRRIGQRGAIRSPKSKEKSQSGTGMKKLLMKKYIIVIAMARVKFNGKEEESWPNFGYFFSIVIPVLGTS